MRTNMRIPELLAPVGSMDHLKVAINAGASSIYLSGKEYGARRSSTLRTWSRNSRERL